MSYDYSNTNISQKLKKFFENIIDKHEHVLPGWMNSLSYMELQSLMKNKIYKKQIYLNSNKVFDKKKPYMRNAQTYYFKYYLPLILQKVDQASMFHSVEHRSPFLSKKILNFSLGTNYTKIYKPFRSKYILKKIFKKFIPNIILKQKKHGFAFPKNEILDQEDKVKKNH